MLFAALLTVFAATPFPSESIGSPPPPAVVRVYVLEKDARSSGSGTLVTPDTIITCNHVVKDRSKDDVEVMFGNWDVVIGKVIKVDANYDLALIKLNAPRTEKPMALASCQLGDEVAINGFGYGPYLEQTGKYEEQDTTKKWCIVKGAQARSGDSGGPVTKDGEIVGVLWGAAKDQTWFTNGGEIIKLFPELVLAPQTIVLGYDKL